MCLLAHNRRGSFCWFAGPKSCDEQKNSALFGDRPLVSPTCHECPAAVLTRTIARQRPNWIHVGGNVTRTGLAPRIAPFSFVWVA